MTETEINKLKRNDKQLQEFVYKKFSTTIYKLMLRYVNNEQDAADLVNRAFYKSFENIKKFEWQSEKSYEVWLKQIAVNEALQFLRKKKINWIELKNIHETTLNHDVAEQEFTGDQIHNFIRELPDGYRTVFNLFVIEEYSHKQISALLGISESASRSQLTRARDLLKSNILKFRKSLNN